MWSVKKPHGFTKWNHMIFHMCFFGRGWASSLLSRLLFFLVVMGLLWVYRIDRWSYVLLGINSISLIVSFIWNCSIGMEMNSWIHEFRWIWHIQLWPTHCIAGSIKKQHLYIHVLVLCKSTQSHLLLDMVTLIFLFLLQVYGLT